MVDELLHYLGESHPECLPNSARVSSFFKPLTPSPIYKQSIDEMIQKIEQQAKAETEGELSSSSQASKQTKVESHIDEQEKFHYSRLFLSHAGLLSGKSLKRIYFVAESQRFRRILKDLDRFTA